MRTLILSLIAFFAMVVAQSQPADFSRISMESRIYNEDILSMKIDKVDHDFSLPVVVLGSSEQLVLHFDDRSDHARYLKYTLIHCTYDWLPTSGLKRNEYLETFEEAEVRDYQTSINCVQFYTAYSITFPNEEISPSVSGNYILYVYDGDTEEPILTQRFYVVENKVTLSLSVTQPIDISLRQTHQQISAIVSPHSFKILSPGRYLKLAVMQNGRTDNRQIASTPYIVTADKLQYSKADEFVFEGGSEFRIFNIRTLRTIMEGVRSHDFVAGVNYSYLYPDKARPYATYIDEYDINGSYFVATDDGNDYYAADYTDVVFMLDVDKPADVDIYIYGELTNWEIQPWAKLDYNQYKKAWEGRLYLKMGYYNYTYIALPKNQKKATCVYTEGNHWQTNNRYNAFVYYSGDNLGYDRIIGCEEIESYKKTQ